MKFTNYLEKIAHVEIYPIISLLLFVAFFIGVTIWVFRMSKKDVDEMANLPLED